MSCEWTRYKGIVGCHVLNINGTYADRSDPDLSRVMDCMSLKKTFAVPLEPVLHQRRPYGPRRAEAKRDDPHRCSS